MKSNRRPLLFAAFALATLMFVPSAMAQIPEYSTLQIDEPVNVAGKILQPGTYRIQVVPNLRTKYQVQVTSPDGMEIYHTFLTVPHPLPAPDDDQPNTIFVWYPSINGEPKALRTWYSPDSPTDGGRDIVYDEDFAKRLARANQTTVPSYTGTIETAEIHTVTPDERVEVYTPPAPAPAPQVAVVTPNVTEEEDDTMVAGARTEREELPRTASNTPLVALGGLVALGAAVALRAYARS